jgi:hypothetical protein
VHRPKKVLCTGMTRPEAEAMIPEESRREYRWPSCPTQRDQGLARWPYRGEAVRGGGGVGGGVRRESIGRTKSEW